jgi:hypothetical protein
MRGTTFLCGKPPRRAESPEFRAEYQALEAEFALASALIEARSQGGMT